MQHGSSMVRAADWLTEVVGSIRSSNSETFSAVTLPVTKQLSQHNLLHRYIQRHSIIALNNSVFLLNLPFAKNIVFKQLTLHARF